MGLSLPREIAYDAFVAVMNRRAKPEEFLNEAFSTYDKKLKRIDRNFIKEILFGSLRWHKKLYWILQNTSKRDLDKSSGEIVAALVVGTYQIFYLDRVPDRAAVNESVEYVRKRGQASACSFVNGILRQIARRAEYFKKPDKVEQPVEYLSIQFAHPEWLVRRWLKKFRFERMEQILARNNMAPVITARLNLLKVSPEKNHDLQVQLLKEESIHTDRRPLRSALRFKDAPKFGQGSIFSQGLYTIQDESSQLIAMMLAPQEEQTIVDACAGPGGKLSHIYELGKGTLNLVAIEKDEKRLELTKKAMERLDHQTGVTYVGEDFREWKPDYPVHKILLDAPCSGMGVLRRHPEGKWHKSESAIPAMAETQWEMIRHGLSLLDEGGELVYSVCSFESEEGEAHMRRLEKEFGDHIKVVSPSDRIPDFYKKYVNRSRILEVYSGNQDDMDGFAAFIIKVQKKIG